MRHLPSLSGVIYRNDITITGRVQQHSDLVFRPEEERSWRFWVAASNLADEPLIDSQGEITLSPRAQSLLGDAAELDRAFLNFLNTPRGGSFRHFFQRHQFQRRLRSRTSARNQFYCRVLSNRRDRVNALVELDLGGGDRLSANITRKSAETLGLVAGRSCHALIDPAWVEIRQRDPSQGIPHPNCLTGRVIHYLNDPVDTEVTIALPGGRMLVALLTQAETREKGLCEGATVTALIPPSQIILAIDGEPSWESVSYQGNPS